MSACRHQRSWIIGSYEWCYQCGAFRSLQAIRTADGQVTNRCYPISAWCKPSGSNGANPYDDWRKRSDKYNERMRRRR